MAPKSPWSVKGIAPEDREVAKTAARKAGMSVGAWLSSRIQASLEEESAAESMVAGDLQSDAHGDLQDDAHGDAGAMGASDLSDLDHDRDDESAGRSNDNMRANEGPFQDDNSGDLRAGDPRFAFGPGQWRNAEFALEDGRFQQNSAEIPVPPLYPPMPPSYNLGQNSRQNPAIYAQDPAQNPAQNPAMQGHQPAPQHYAPAPDHGLPPDYMAMAGGMQGYHAAMPTMPAPGHMPGMPPQMMPYQAAPQPVPMAASAPAPEPAPPGVDPDEFRELEHKVDSLDRLQDAVEDRLTTRIETLTTRIDTLSRRMDSLADEVDDLSKAPAQAPVAASGDAIAFSTAPIERAVMRLSERLQRVEDVTLTSDGTRRGLFSRLFRRK